MGEVCFDLQVEYEGRDLRRGFDLLSSPLPDRTFDLIFWHPPYWPGHRYTPHPNDFSNAKNQAEYLERMRAGFTRLQTVLAAERHLAVLIGDGRKNGVFYPVHAAMLQWQARHFKYGPTRFIPTFHEYVLIFKGSQA